MLRLLPSNPSLEHLKKQAKDLLKESRAGNSRLYGRIQAGLPRFKGKSMDEILSVGITLHDAQYLIANEYGFDKWDALREVVEAEPEGLAFPGHGNTVLTEEELQSFRERGYVRIPQAFPRETALRIQDFMWAELERLHGIHRHDRSTWPTPRADARWGQRYGLKKTKDNAIYNGIGSRRLLNAMYQIIGPRSWVKNSWGGFLISFPVQGEGPWTVSRDFHPEIGAGPDLKVWRPPHLLTFAHVSDVRPKGGGTLVVEGSHRLVVRYFNGLKEVRAKQKTLIAKFARSHPWLAELMGKTPDQGDRLRRFMSEGAMIEGVHARVVELTGEPGDAVLWHPALLHARSQNRSDTPKFVLR